MNTHDDTASEPAAAAASRRGGPDWGHLPHADLTDLIIGAGFEVHNVMGGGFLEAVYVNALTVELRRRGVRVDRNVAFEVVYRGVSVGRYVADLVVDGKVIVETKVAKAIDLAHRAQVSNYLRASGLEVGLVINFGSSVQFKRVVSSPHRVRDATGNQPSDDHSGTTARPDTDEPRSPR
jgi:GxxExxY protein